MKFNCMLLISFIFFTLCASIGFAQSGFVATGGNTQMDDGKSLSYTIGQIDYVNLIQSGKMVVNYGLQQPYEISAITPTTFVFEGMDITFFPNPTHSDINIRLGQMSDNELSYTLIDIQGRILKKGVLVEGLQSISTVSLLPGNYLIRLSTSQNESFTFKFVKQ